MNWIAYLPFAVERALVDYVRQATVPGIAGEFIYAGQAHGSSDKPSDASKILEAFERIAEGGTVNNEDLPHDDETIKSPRIVIVCPEVNAEDGFIGGEVMTADVRVELTTHSDDVSGEQHAQLAGRLFDLFCDPLFVDRCNLVSTDFTINGRLVQKVGYKIDGHNWVSALEMKMQCCAAEI